MELPWVDLAVLVAYLAGVVLFGCYFVRKTHSVAEFTSAGGAMPGWAVGLSLFGTYLSSNTFLGVPGKAYGSNWNFFVFSLSIPIVAWIGARCFVPFYRRSGEISAYHHLEKRFGPWARTYAVVCYLLTQIARIGSVMFGVSLALHALVGWDLRAIIVVGGVLVTLYTVMGGIEAVIWTDVAQSLVLMVGALVVCAMVLFGSPGGPSEALSVAWTHGKFSLGSFGPSLTQSTFWVVLLYGVFINLSNFGIDQSYVQRYLAAKSDREARKSVWMGGLLYVPISMVFFLIGSALFAYYQATPGIRHEVAVTVAQQRAGFDPEALATVETTAETLTDAEIGDKVLPHFMATRLTGGFAGLLIAAILAAAMSSIDTSLNSSATVILSDIYKRYLNPDVEDRKGLALLRNLTIVMGVVGTGAALAMIRVESILQTWWELQGVFAGGMLGLFLLGVIARKATSPAAVTGLAVGVLVIAWLSLSPRIAALPDYLRSPLHANMTIVIGTLTIFLVGLLVSGFRRARVGGA